MSKFDELKKSLRSGADPDKNFFPYKAWGEAADAIEEQEKQIEKLKDALEGLVSVKDYKELFGKDSFYLQSKKDAWGEARKVLEEMK